MQQSKKDILKEILRFLVVGGFATICDYVTFYLFNLVFLKAIDPNINIIISVTVGFLVGLLVNWVLQKFVYRYISAKQAKSPRVFLKFVILSLIGLCITELGMFIGQSYYFGTLLITRYNIDFWKLFTKCLMTGIVLIINYIGRKLFVFNSKEDLNSRENKKED